MASQNKKFTILAGPNGSGKTTFVHSIFPEILRNHKFINADHFAQDLNPSDVAKVAIQAGRKFLKEVDILLLENNSFIIETTLSGKSLLRKIQTAHENGFEIHLIYLWISSPGLCDFRVKGRVASGGHNIPLGDIERRYKRGLLNLSDYRAVVDHCDIYLADEHPVIILSESKHSGKVIKSPFFFDQLMAAIAQSGT